MATTRPQLPNNAQQAIDDAEANKTNASQAGGLADLADVVADNASAIQMNSAAIQRLEREVRRLLEIQGRT